MSDPIIACPDKPMQVAEVFARQSEERLVSWQGSLYRFTGGYYRQLADSDLHAELYLWLASKKFTKSTTTGSQNLDWDPNRKKVGDVIDALKAVVHIPHSTVPRSWIGDPQDPGFTGDLDLVIPASEGILHVGEGGQEKWMECDDNFFCLSAVQLPDTGTGYYFKYLDSIGFDYSDRAYYAELNGAAIANWWPEQKAHMKVGPSRCGKGTLKGLTKELVGYGAVSPSMTQLASHLEREVIIGATYISISENRGAPRDTKAALELFLSATGGDEVSLGRKHKAAWSGKLTALWDFDTNMTSSFRDPSGSVATRFIGLKFEKSFLGKEDTRIPVWLHADIRTVFDEAISGLHRLIAQNKFTRPKRWSVIAGELRSMTSIQLTFLEEKYDFAEDGWVLESEMWKTWQAFCIGGNYRPGTKHDMLASLRAAADNLGSPIRTGTLSRVEAEAKGHNSRLPVIRGVRPKVSGF